ncbi:MAG TPA: hypothetical protein VNT30_20665 [Stellaceae bacterium]|nr:hypothetical protein [Stellaceae bacterium]
MPSQRMEERPETTLSPATSPFLSICKEYLCDIAIPNITGIGDVLMYTRVVEELALRYGRPLNLLTGRIRPIDGVGTVDGEEPYPIWRANPFVDKIVDMEQIDPEILKKINASHEQHCHFGHIISNICSEYGIVPRTLRPSLYLTESECREALLRLSELSRPILCIHPYGTSSPREGHRWYHDEWIRLIEGLPQGVSVIEVGLHGKEDKALPARRFRTTLREMMAIVWASDLFLGFDSSAAHVATAFCKPAMVLWDPIRKTEIDERIQSGLGPAAFSRWSYPQNRNLMLLGETSGEIRKIALTWIHEFCRSIGPQYQF